MKINRILLLLIPALVAGGCAPDDGNYDYSTTNTITIADIDDQEVDQYEVLEVTPDLSFLQDDLSDLGFEWVLDGEVISTDPVLSEEIVLAANGTTSTNSNPYSARLCVTNNANGLKYYKTFQVRVRTSLTNSLFILSEAADGTAKISIQRRDRENAPVVNDVFESNNPGYGPLGKYPKMMQYNMGKSRRASFVNVVCGEPAVVAAMNPVSMMLERVYNKDMLGANYEGAFNPSFVYSVRDGMMLSNGQAFMFNLFNSGGIYFPIEGNYNFTWTGGSMSYDAYAMVAYDENSSQFMMLEPQSGNLADYSIVTPLIIENDPDFSSGQKFIINGYTYNIQAEGSDPLVILYKDDVAYFYRVVIDAVLDEFIWDYIITITPRLLYTKTGILNETSVGYHCWNEVSWFLGTGNKVYKQARDGGDHREWFTVPKGTITTLIADERDAGTRVFIATYDGSKSYIYVIDATTPNSLLESQPLEVDGKIISLGCNGSWTY